MHHAEPQGDARLFYRETSDMDGERLLAQEIPASFERGEWKPVRNQKCEVARFKAAVQAALLKNKRVNIRISSRDLEGLQARAAEEGIPYQTLMSSVLHRFVSGRLAETQGRIPSKYSALNLSPPNRANDL
jgi:predicted DNA binding CopG/RHH family protein